MSSCHLGQLGHLGDLGHLFHPVVKVIEVVSVIKVIEDIKVIDDRGHQGHRCHQCQQGHRGHQGQLCHLGHLFTKLPSHHSLVFNTTTNWLTNGRTTLGLSGLLLQYVYKAYRSASTKYMFSWCRSFQQIERVGSFNRLPNTSDRAQNLKHLNLMFFRGRDIRKHFLREIGWRAQ